MTEDRRIQIGPVGKKVLLILQTGAALSLTRRPDAYFRILRQAGREWKKIDEESLRRTIKRLYQSKLVGCREHNDGTVELVLSDEGKQRSLRYRVEKLEIKKPATWDGLWRIVLFDIPERHKKGRDALAQKLKGLGFVTLQKSVFVFPYECKDEIDFIVELFKLRPYVRTIVAREIDSAVHLKHKFGLPR